MGNCRQNDKLSLAHSTETKIKEKFKNKNRIAQKKRCRHKSMQAVREEEVELRGIMDEQSGKTEDEEVIGRMYITLCNN